MKTPTTLLTALLVFAAGTLAEDLEGQCADKSPQVVNAIATFCTEGAREAGGLHVPTFWSESGVWSEKSEYKHHRAHVSIWGSCKPPQWVPEWYCFKQFYRMCVDGDGEGNRAVRHGKDLCQRWVISHT